MAAFANSGSFTVDGVIGTCTYTGRDTAANKFTGVSGCTGTPAGGAVVVVVGPTLPGAGSLAVASVAGFADSGSFTVAGVTGTCSYTGRDKVNNLFTGVTGCTGTPKDGAAVRNGGDNDRNSLSAIVDSATVTGGTGVGVKATSTQTIDALTLGGALNGDFGGGDGLNLAGGGAGARNWIRVDVLATIRNGGTARPSTATTGALEVIAMDTSTITSDAGGFGISLK